MQVLLGGSVFLINDLRPDMDQAFLDLYAAFFSNHSLNLADFEEAANKFFDAHANDATSQDKFFNNFTPIWSQFLSSGQFDRAEWVWEIALHPALKWEGQNQGRFIHKGTPFYFQGMTAILKGDLEKGYLLMHQALEEDRRTTGKEHPKAPAFAFVTLDYKEVDQAFRQWLLDQAQFLSELLNQYRSSRAKNLQLDDFRKRFLENPPNSDTLFLFAYALAKLLQLDKTPSFALKSDFASQLQINLLFDIALVIDAAIKAKNPKVTQWKFIDLAVFLSEKAKLSLTQKRLTDINGGLKDKFDATLRGLLDNTFKFQNGSVLSPQEADLATTYALRNHGAHNVTSAQVVWERFADVRQSLFNTLFLCVEELY